STRVIATRAAVEGIGALRDVDRPQREHDREIPGCALGGRSAGQFPLVPHSCEPIDLLASCDSEGDFGTESPHLVLSANDQVLESNRSSLNLWCPSCATPAVKPPPRKS